MDENPTDLRTKGANSLLKTVFAVAAGAGAVSVTAGLATFTFAGRSMEMSVIAGACAGFGSLAFGIIPIVSALEDRFKPRL